MSDIIDIPIQFNVEAGIQDAAKKISDFTHKSAKQEPINIPLKVDTSPLTRLSSAFNKTRMDASKATNDMKAALAQLIVTGKGGTAEFNKLKKELIDSSLASKKLQKALDTVDKELDQVGHKAPSIGQKIKSSFAGVGQTIMGVFGGGALLGAMTQIPNFVNKVVADLNSIDDLKDAFRAAGVSAQDFNAQVERSANLASDLGERWTISKMEIRSVQHDVAKLGGLSGELNDKVTTLAIGIEKYSNGAIDASAVIRAFSKDMGSPDAVDGIGRLEVAYPALATALKTIKDPAKKVSAAMEFMKDKFKDLEVDTAAEEVGRLKLKLSETSIEIGKIILMPLLSFFGSISGAILPITAAILLAVAAQKAWGLYTGLSTVITTAYTAATTGAAAGTSGWSTAQAILNAVMAANPLGALLVVIGLVISAIVIMVKNWNAILNILKKVWDFVWNSLISVFKFLVHWISEIVVFALKWLNVWGLLYQGLQLIVPTIKKFIDDYFPGLGRAINSVVGFVKGLIGWVSNLATKIGAFLGIVKDNKEEKLVKTNEGLNKVATNATKAKEEVIKVKKEFDEINADNLDRAKAKLYEMKKAGKSNSEEFKKLKKSILEFTAEQKKVEGFNQALDGTGKKVETVGSKAKTTKEQLDEMIKSLVKIDTSTVAGAKAYDEMIAKATRLKDILDEREQKEKKIHEEIDKQTIAAKKLLPTATKIAKTTKEQLDEMIKSLVKIDTSTVAGRRAYDEMTAKAAKLKDILNEREQKEKKIHEDINKQTIETKNLSKASKPLGVETDKMGKKTKELSKDYSSLGKGISTSLKEAGGSFTSTEEKTKAMGDQIAESLSNFSKSVGEMLKIGKSNLEDFGNAALENIIDVVSKAVVLYAVEIVASFAGTGPWGFALGLVVSGMVLGMLSAAKSAIGAEEGIQNIKPGYNRQAGTADKINILLAEDETVLSKKMSDTHKNLISSVFFGNETERAYFERNFIEPTANLRGISFNAIQAMNYSQDKTLQEFIKMNGHLSGIEKNTSNSINSTEFLIDVTKEIRNNTKALKNFKTIKIQANEYYRG